jgi:hypothetical protein
VCSYRLIRRSNITLTTLLFDIESIDSKIFPKSLKTQSSHRSSFMPASDQRKVRFSEPWDDDDIILARMETSSTCKFHEDHLTTMLWNLDEKKIRMLKTLHADDADVLSRDRHRVHRDHGQHCNQLMECSGLLQLITQPSSSLTTNKTPKWVRVGPIRRCISYFTNNTQRPTIKQSMI